MFIYDSCLYECVYSTVWVPELVALSSPIYITQWYYRRAMTLWWGREAYDCRVARNRE